MGYTTLTVSPGFSSPVHTGTWTYNGYFIKPVYQNSLKTGTPVIYPGGSLEVTANNGNGGVVWGLATIQTAAANPPTQLCPTLTAMLNAYSIPTLTQLWSSYNTSNPGHCYGPCFSDYAAAAAEFLRGSGRHLRLAYDCKWKRLYSHLPDHLFSR